MSEIKVELVEGQTLIDTDENMFKTYEGKEVPIFTKYSFPIAHVSREQLQAFLISIGRTTKLPEDVPYFHIRVPGKFNPLQVNKSIPDAVKIVEAWKADGIEAELV